MFTFVPILYKAREFSCLLHFYHKVGHMAWAYLWHTFFPVVGVVLPQLLFSSMRSQLRNQEVSMGQHTQVVSDHIRKLDARTAGWDFSKLPGFEKNVFNVLHLPARLQALCVQLQGCQEKVVLQQFARDLIPVSVAFVIARRRCLLANVSIPPHLCHSSGRDSCPADKHDHTPRSLLISSLGCSWCGNSSYLNWTHRSCSFTSISGDSYQCNCNCVSKA